MHVDIQYDHNKYHVSTVIVMLLSEMKTTRTPCVSVLWTLTREGKQRFPFSLSLFVDHTVRKNDLEDNQSTSAPWTQGVRCFSGDKHTEKSKTERFNLSQERVRVAYSELWRKPEPLVFLLCAPVQMNVYKHKI